MIAQKKASSQLKTPGDRLKYVRSLLRVSRAYIQTHYALSVDTLRAWENNKSPLTEKGAQRCITIYRQEGIDISEDWLLRGNGLDPKISVELGRYIRDIQPTYKIKKQNDEMLLVHEIDFFKKSSSNAVVMLVTNEEMEPFYSIGDYVGGYFKFGKNIAKAVNKDCIVITKDKQQYFRRLVKSEDDLTYNLICLNPKWNQVSAPVLFDVEIDCVAPVIWHRRPDR